MNRYRTIAESLVVSILLAGCQSTTEYVGEGPITLSPTVAAVYQVYREGDPKFFAITPDGAGYYHTYCPSWGNCLKGSPGDVIRNCNEKLSKRGSCKLFADRDDVVWKGPVTLPYKRPNEYPLLLSWRSSSEVIEVGGIAVMKPDKPVILLRALQDNVMCTGRADRETWSWELLCGAYNSIQGTFHEVIDSKYKPRKYRGRSDSRTKSTAVRFNLGCHMRAH